MALKKGEVLNPHGRPKGAANKTTSEIRAAFQQLVSNNIDTLQDDIDKLEPEKRIAYIIKFAEFLLPKLQSLDPATAIQMEYLALEKLLTQCPDDAIEKIVEKIEQLKKISYE